MIYELRIYEVVPGKLEALNKRFAEVTLKLFDKHGIKSIGYWTEEVGTSNQLVYMVAYESLADREKKRPGFLNDPEWLRARAETEREGPLVTRIHNRILVPTSFSPLK